MSPARSQSCVRGAGGSGRPSASRSSCPSSSTGWPGVVHRPPDVVDRLPVAGAQRKAARVDPRQPGRMRAGAGREGVPAEVERLGVAGLDQRADRARRGQRHERPADPRQEAAPRGVARERSRRRREPVEVLRHRSRTAPRRRSAVASTLSSWARLLKVPLARTVPSVVEWRWRTGCPGSRARATASASATSSKTPTATCGSFATFSIAGESVWQRWQPSELKTARPRRSAPLATAPRGERPAHPRASRRRAPPRRSRALPGCRAAAGACPTSRASASTRDRQAGAGEQRDADRDPKPRVGAERDRVEQRDQREARREREVAEHPEPGDRGARTEAGARRPGPAAKERAHRERGEQQHQRRRGIGGGVRAERDARRASASSTAISPAQAIGRSGPPSKPKLAMRRDAGARRGKLRERGARQHDAKPDPQNDLHIPPAQPSTAGRTRSAALSEPAPHLLVAALPLLLVVDPLALRERFARRSRRATLVCAGGVRAAGGDGRSPRAGPCRRSSRQAR